MLVHLGEVDARRLYLGEGCSSMFDFCVRVLRFAEGVGYKRIGVARAARRHPELLEAIRRGDLHVTAASLLVPQLTQENVRELILAATHRTAEQVRVLMADRRPRPDVATSVRRLGAVSPAMPFGMPAWSAAPAASEWQPSAPVPARASPQPLGGERYCVRFTAGPETWAQLAELRALMRHQVPDGDVGTILGRAVSALLAQIRRQKLGAGSRSRASNAPSPTRSPSRAIPAAMRREVFRRDGGRCTYVSPNGRRCGAREFVEFHHTDPWARSRCHSVEGITLRCRAHNRYEAKRDFGGRRRARLRSASEVV